MIKIGKIELREEFILLLIFIAGILLSLPLGFISKGYGDVKVVPVDSNGNPIKIKGMPITCMYNNKLQYTNSQGYTVFTHLPSPKDPSIKFKFKVNCPDCWGFSSEYCYIHVKADTTNVLYCKLSGTAPEDGEMKCGSLGPMKYSASLQKWQQVEECGGNEACVCTDKFHCICKSTGCTPGWFCKGSNIKAYRKSDCSVTTYQCPSSTPYCYDGMCVECYSDTQCNDFHYYTEDKCINHKCYHYGEKPTTTTTIPVIVTTTLPPTVTTTIPAETCKEVCKELGYVTGGCFDTKQGYYIGKQGCPNDAPYCCCLTATTTTTTSTTTTPPIITTTTFYIPPFCTSNAECDDHDVCTLDKCVDGECVHIFQDKDDDGICDAKDKCPEEYGVAEHGGCPAPAPPWIWIGVGIGVIVIAVLFVFALRRK